MKLIKLSVPVILVLLVNTGCDSGKNSKTDKLAGNPGVIRESSEDPRYFEYSDGSPYIPVGMNIISRNSGMVFLLY